MNRLSSRFLLHPPIHTLRPYLLACFLLAVQLSLGVHSLAMICLLLLLGFSEVLLAHLMKVMFVVDVAMLLIPGGRVVGLLIAIFDFDT